MLGTLLSACASGGAGAPARPPSAAAPAAVPADEGAQRSCEERLRRCQDTAEAQAEADPQGAEQALHGCARCPGFPPAQAVLLANLQEERGDVPAARATLRDNARGHPDSAALWWQLARLALKAGHVSEGLGAYQRARRLAPKNTTLAQAAHRAQLRYGGDAVRLAGELSVLFEEVEAALQREEAERARALLEAALPRMAPSADLQAELLFQLARLRVAAGEAEPAMDAIEAALDLTRAELLRAQLHLLKSELHLAWEEFALAARAARAATAEAPADPLPWVNLAVAEGRLGTSAAAVRAFQEAFKRGLARRLPAAAFDGLIDGLPLLRQDPALARIRAKAYPPAPAPGPAPDPEPAPQDP